MGLNFFSQTGFLATPLTQIVRCHAHPPTHTSIPTYTSPGESIGRQGAEWGETEERRGRGAGYKGRAKVVQTDLMLVGGGCCPDTFDAWVGPKRRRGTGEDEKRG